VCVCVLTLCVLIHSHLQFTQTAPIDPNLPVEIQLAKRLAHNDGKIRTRAMILLRKYLSRSSKPSTSSSSSSSSSSPSTATTTKPSEEVESKDEVEMLKMWRGLFYCMWMSDKSHIQQELGEKLAHILEELTPERALLYWRCCWITFQKEWTGIDRFVMD
jgi:hypothetical protein